jgi:hypothetical protein
MWVYFTHILFVPDYHFDVIHFASNSYISLRAFRVTVTIRPIPNRQAKDMHQDTKATIWMGLLGFGIGILSVSGCLVADEAWDWFGVALGGLVSITLLVLCVACFVNLKFRERFWNMRVGPRDK